jgi:hypothetical protein
MPLKGQASSTEIPEDRAQRRQPLGAQNHVITFKRHNKQIDEENIVIDNDRRLTYDVHTRHPIVVFYYKKMLQSLRSALPIQELGLNVIPKLIFLPCFAMYNQRS